MGEHGNCSADLITYLHPHPAPFPGFLPASCSQLLPLPAADFVPEQLCKQPVGYKEIPVVCACAPGSSHLSPDLPTQFLYILRKAGKENSCGKTLICPLYTCLWNLEKDKGGTVLLLHSCPCFQTVNSLFPLLQSTMYLYLLPLLPAVYSTPHSCPVLFRSHPMLPGHF